jgi:DsbC/DsbD-like thiol-disulfide interchange protein
MKNRVCRISALIVAAIGVLFAGAQTARAQGGPPKFLKVAATAPKTALLGKPFTVTVAITIDPPYHIQGNPPKEGFVATVVKLGATKDFKLGKITYPKPTEAKIGTDTLPVYEGTVEVKVQVTALKAGKLKLPVSVRYQGCNESACYPPNTAETTAQVTVGGKTVVSAK